MSEFKEQFLDDNLNNYSRKASISMRTLAREYDLPLQLFKELSATGRLSFDFLGRLSPYSWKMYLKDVGEGTLDAGRERWWDRYNDKKWIK